MKSHVAGTALLLATTVLRLQAFAQSEHGPLVDVTRLDGATTTGHVAQLTPDLHLVYDGGDTRLPWSEILSLQPRDPADIGVQSATPFPLRITLSDGSVFHAHIANAQGETIELDIEFADAITPPVLAIQTIEITGAPNAARQRFSTVLQEQNQAREAPGPDAPDVIVVTRENEALVLRGRVVALDGKHARFQWNRRELPLPWPRIAGVHFGRPETRAAPCLVRLSDGQAFGGTLVGGDNNSIELATSTLDAELTIPWKRVARINCRSQKLVLLSDLHPSEYRFEPLFEKRWNYARNQSLINKPISLQGRKFKHGIVMHSRATLTYDIGGHFLQFAATVGIVDDMESRGNVTLRVTGDGRLLWEGTDIRGGAPPRDVTVDIRNVKTLTLIVDYGKELDLSDHAAWAEARLIR